MYLQDAIALFVRDRSPETLRNILKEHGIRGFSLACRAAGLRRGKARRLIGIYNDEGPIREVATRACGLKIPVWR